MKRLLVAFVLSFIFFTAAIYFYQNTRSRALEDSDRELASRAEIVAESIDRLLQSRMVGTFTFATLPSLRGFAASNEEARPSRMAVAQSELRAIVTADPSIIAASIADTKGHVILTTDTSMDADWSKRLFVQEGLKGRLHSSAPASDSGDIVQYYCAPILDNDGNVAGVLVVRVDAQEFWNAISLVENVLIVDENGVRIADNSTVPQIFAAIAPMSNEAIAQLLEGERYGSGIRQIPVVPIPAVANQIKNKSTAANFRAAGTAMRAAIRTIATNPWSVVVMSNEDSMLASANVAFWQAFGLGGIAGLLVAVLAYLVRGAPQ